MTPADVIIECRRCGLCGAGWPVGSFYSDRLDLCKDCGKVIEQAISKTSDQAKRHAWLYRWDDKRHTWRKSRQHGSPLREVVVAAAAVVLQESTR